MYITSFITIYHVLCRCRWGYFHVVNNDYTHWLMYAIGGSKNPTIISQGNRYTAPPNLTAKQITKHLGAAEEEWKNWVYMALGGGPVHGGDLLHHVRRCDPEAVQQQGPDQAQARILRHEAHPLRWLHPMRGRQAVLERGGRPTGSTASRRRFLFCSCVSLFFLLHIRTYSRNLDLWPAGFWSL